MPNPRTLRRLAHLVSLVFLTLGLIACSRPTGMIASAGGQSLTVADLDAYLLSLPEPERRLPPGSEPGEWLEAKLRRLALERVLGATEKMARLEASPETAARRFMLRTNTLISALVQDLAREATPTEEEVAAKAQALAEQRSSEAVLNFQHIFWRTDRGGDFAALRARAAAVAAEAAAGADFTALVRAHSESADAETGGMVQNARASDLEEESFRALAALAEGQVGPLIETRTGLHLLRLVRRLEPEPPHQAQLAAGARRLLQQAGVADRRRALLEERRRRVEIDTGAGSWQVGGLTLDQTTVEILLRGGDGQEDGGQEDGGLEDGGQESGGAGAGLIDHLLLAGEALERDLETPETVELLARGSRLWLLEQLFAERRAAADAELGEDLLRPFYDAQPALFTEPEQVRLKLIFVPQGRDSFATQKRLEAHVAELRGGGVAPEGGKRASFEALARDLSTGPGAAEGGDLGLKKLGELVRYSPEIAAAVPALEIGEISDPIYCTGRVLSRDPLLLRAGFAVVRVEERLAERRRSFEQAVDDVRRAYANQHRGELDQMLQDRILEEADFEILRLPDPGELR